MRNFKWTKRNILCLLLLVLALIFIISTILVVHFVVQNKAAEGVSLATQSMRAAPIPHDDTKLDLPSWTIDLMLIFMWVVIGIIGFGILCLIVYIFGHFWKRRHGTLLARVSEQVEVNEENPNLVRITLGEEVKDEKSN